MKPYLLMMGAIFLAWIAGFLAGCSTTQPREQVDVMKRDPGGPVLSYEQLYMDERPTGVYLIHMKFDTVRSIDWEAVFDNGDVLVRKPTGRANDWVIWLAANEQWSVKPAELPSWLDSLLVK